MCVCVGGGGGEGGEGSALIILKSCFRNYVTSFQHDDFLMNTALRLNVQKALSQVKMEIEGNSLRRYCLGWYRSWKNYTSLKDPEKGTMV